jgi:hypothetical protein
MRLYEPGELPAVAANAQWRRSSGVIGFSDEVGEPNRRFKDRRMTALDIDESSGSRVNRLRGCPGSSDFQV